jgi:hypothetical protein
MLEPQYRLANLLGDGKFEGLDTLLSRLLDLDPRARLTDWTVILPEIRRLRNELTGADREGAAPVPPDESNVLRLARQYGNTSGAQARRHDRLRLQSDQDDYNGIREAIAKEFTACLAAHFQQLTEATGGDVVFAVSSSDPVTRQAVRYYPIYQTDFGQVADWSLHQHAAVGAALYVAGQRVIPSIWLGVYLVVSEQRVWPFRLALIKDYRTSTHTPIPSPGYADLAPQALTSPSVVVGPLALTLPSAREEAGAFARDSANVARRLAARYMQGINDGRDLMDSDWWTID